MRILFKYAFLLVLSFAVNAEEYVVDERKTDESASRSINFKVEERWSLSKPDNYYYIFASEGWMTFFPLVAVYVYDGKVVKVSNLHPFMNKHMTPDIDQFMTIDRLLEFALESSKLENEYFELKYSPVFGYPEHIRIKPKGKHHGDKDYKIIGFGAIKKSNHSVVVDSTNNKSL